MSQPKARKPDLILWIRDKHNPKERTRAGAAWRTEFPDGRIAYTIKISPGIVIDQRLLETHYLGLNEPMTDEAYENFIQGKGLTMTDDEAKGLIK